MEKKRKFQGNNIIWILLLVTLLYIFAAGIAEELLGYLLITLADWSPAMHFILQYYTAVFAEIVVLIIILYIIKKNRFILRSLGPAGMSGDFPVLVTEDRFQLVNNNTGRMLLIGLLLGFITNFTCILCAIVHGDIRLYYGFSVTRVPALCFAFVSVFIQSACEEMWCRGYMYERINIHYPLWVSVLVNGVYFGLLHSFNPGVSVLAIVGIAVCGISYSLVRWYTGSIWICMGLHTMWNFTQNFLFGLPNSGLISEMSVFHLDAASGINTLVYDYGFGVEAAIPALIVDAALGIGVIWLAHREGRLGELRMSHERRLAEAAN